MHDVTNQVTMKYESNKTSNQGIFSLVGEEAFLVIWGNIYCKNKRKGKTKTE